VTGFIRGLFGSKSKGDAEEVIQPKDAFFLPDDDAKTFGNIEYMRSTKRTRRTFPKQAVGENNEYINEVSSTQKAKPAEKSAFSTSPFNTAPAESNGKPAESDSTSTNSSARRRSDSSMDMFRNMARDIKKG
jgi:hypothetical protein